METDGGPGTPFPPQLLLCWAVLVRGSCCGSHCGWGSRLAAPLPTPSLRSQRVGAEAAPPGHRAADCPVAAAAGARLQFLSAAAPGASARQDSTGGVGGVFMSSSFALCTRTRDGAAGAHHAGPRRPHGRAGSSVHTGSRAAWSGHSHQPFTVRGRWSSLGTKGRGDAAGSAADIKWECWVLWAGLGLVCKLVLYSAM